MIAPSKRSQGVSYAIREVVVPARELKKKGIEILHLNIGDPNKYDFPRNLIEYGVGYWHCEKHCENSYRCFHHFAITSRL